MTSIKQAYSYNYSVEFQSEIRLFRLRIAENSFASFLSLSLLVRRLSFYIGAICHFVGCILPISSKTGERRLDMKNSAGAKRRNNSQHYWPNNVASCCVRVGSGVQTDVTTPNNFGTCSASWKGHNP